MAKPICVVKVNESAKSAFEGSEFEFRELSNIVTALQRNISKEYSDYHVLVLPTYGESKSDINEPIQMQVFYDKDFTETNYNELMEYVKSEFKNIK